ncbi:hypothetical protein EJB05_55950 [Eragrostis curvula]|uniref:Uncharacterized protein n=1 Tax=Eragrostis curvula TaxID=38414 RepID=A0A5J9SHF8_9POAL|nr:hypothetical protein EJB05_55950 [Eragrostis curvula]
MLFLIFEPPLHSYQVLRLQQCMRNAARLQQLGIPDLVNSLANSRSTTTNKNKRNYRSSEASDDEYDPLHDDTSEEDLFGDDRPKGLKDPKKTWKKSNKKTVHMPPGGIRPRSKRVFAEQQTTRITRQKTSIAPSNSSDINLAPQDTPVSVEADRPDQLDENTRMANGGDVIAQSDGLNSMAHEAFYFSHDDLVQLDGGMASGAEHCGDIHMANQGEKVRRETGPNMGHGLQRMIRARRSKLPVVIPEGMIRPVIPLVDAKFATECNIIVRNYVPVLKQWIDYKKTGLFELFTGKLCAKFDIDISDPTVEKACLQMETCQKNKENRGLVQFHQTTGSQSYMVLVENLGDKYNDEEPDAFDLFKECHYSKRKKGYTPSVQLAIYEMENKISAPREGEEPKTATQAVADVLAEKTKKSQFLQNVGIQTTRPRTNAKDLEAQLEAEKREKNELARQVKVLSKQVKGTAQGRIKDREEIKKKQADLEAKVELLLAKMQPP